MSKKKIWLSSPHMGGREQHFVNEAFDTNWVAPLGPNVDGFEKDLEQFTGAGHAVALSSGTAAIHLALDLFKVERDDLVICQSFTFSASANPIKYLGAEPVFVDSEPETWNMCPVALELAIQFCIQNRKKKPKAIVVVHLYGMPAKIIELLEVAKRYEIPVVEDAAEALGSHINGKMCGTFGDIGILSFNGNKIITTSGGGALLTENRLFAERARFLATQARDSAPHYQHSNIGYNYRMSNVLAGIGRGQMEVINDRIKSRRKIHDWYQNLMKGVWSDGKNIGEALTGKYNLTNGYLFLREPQGYFSNRWLTTVLILPELTGGLTREVLRLALEEEQIEARPLWKPMHMQPIFKEYMFFKNKSHLKQNEDSVSGWLFEHGLCLPSGSNMTEDEFQRIQTVLTKFI